MEFRELKLSKKILEAIEKMEYVDATPIQELAIPKILDKKDIIGIAQTGTGKTAAFSLPIIDMLINEHNADKKIKVLILTPTRELAIQIRNNILEYSKGTDYKCSVILGGVNQTSQVEVLKKGIDILVATPGRLLDLIRQRKADVSNVKYLVLDEADTMLDMGFIKDIKSIIGNTSKARQTLLFSATMPPEIKDLASQFMNNPLTIKTITEEVTADKINQELYYVDRSNKTNLLLELISVKENPSVLIFTRTKHGANKLAKQLEEYKIKTSVIHGDKTQSNRVRALSDFKSGVTKIMIATDIAARGIDIKDLNIVINYDIPEKAETYIHRIGRTARAGKDGKAISICSSAEISDLRAIEKLINKKIAVIDHQYIMVMDEKKPAQNQNNKRRTAPRTDAKQTSYETPKRKFKQNSKSTNRPTNRPNSKTNSSNRKTNSFNRTNNR